MTYTQHGHYIPGTDVTDPMPDTRARCGGVGLCSKCSREAGEFAKGPILTSGKDYQAHAKRLVSEYIVNHLDKSDEPVGFTVYVVWFSKTLRNWKAMLSSSLPDGMYYEVTYNGADRETYLDAYKKVENQVYKDPEAIDPVTGWSAKRVMDAFEAERDSQVTSD